MVQFEESNQEAGYVPLGSSGTKSSVFVLGGSFTDSRPKVTPIIPLVLDLQESEQGISGNYTLFREFVLPGELLNAVAPVYEVMRSMVINQIANIIDDQINPAHGDPGIEIIKDNTIENHYILGNRALMNEILESVIESNIVKNFLIGLTRHFRNEVGEEMFFAWTGAGNNHLYLNFRVEEERIHVKLKLPNESAEEITAIRASKLQFCLIEALRGMPYGFRAIRFLEMCANHNLLGESIRDKLTFDVDLLDLVDDISERPTMQTTGNLIAYIADKMIEYATFSFVRFKLRPSSWAIELPYQITIYDIDQHGVSNIIKNIKSHYEEDQVKSMAAQGAVMFKMLPFCGSDWTNQVMTNNTGGNPGVQVTRIDRSIQTANLNGRYEIKWFWYKPRQCNAFEEHVNLYFDKAYNKINAALNGLDGYFTIVEVTPPVFSMQIPEYGEYRERQIMWSVFANLMPTVGIVTYNNIFADEVGLRSFLQGKWFALRHTYKNKFGASFSLTYSAKVQELVEGKLQWVSQDFNFKYDPAFMTFKRKNYIIMSGRGKEVFSKLFYGRKRLKPIVQIINEEGLEIIMNSTMEEAVHTTLKAFDFKKGKKISNIEKYNAKKSTK